jgi:hypothetical protein
MVDLPASVIKTRGLLTLRGYKVDELFEYEDRYVMLPVKETGEGAIKSVVWIFKEAKVVGVAIVKDIARDMEEAHGYHYVLINDTIEDAVEKLRCIIVAERCRRLKHLILEENRRQWEE